jgi:hypothetical protein
MISKTFPCKPGDNDIKIFSKGSHPAKPGINKTCYVFKKGVSKYFQIRNQFKKEKG